MIGFVMAVLGLMILLDGLSSDYELQTVIGAGFLVAGIAVVAQSLGLTTGTGRRGRSGCGGGCGAGCGGGSCGGGCGGCGGCGG